jgi:hypothetical protein
VLGENTNENTKKPLTDIERARAALDKSSRDRAKLIRDLCKEHLGMHPGNLADIFDAELRQEGHEAPPETSDAQTPGCRIFLQLARETPYHKP